MGQKELIATLKKIAVRKCWCDDPEFLVADYAAGNIDDAYYGGADDGESLLARFILKELGVV